MLGEDRTSLILVTCEFYIPRAAVARLGCSAKCMWVQGTGTQTGAHRPLVLVRPLTNAAFPGEPHLNLVPSTNLTNLAGAGVGETYLIKFKSS